MECYKMNYIKEIEFYVITVQIQYVAFTGFTNLSCIMF